MHLMAILVACLATTATRTTTIPSVCLFLLLCLFLDFMQRHAHTPFFIVLFFLFIFIYPLLLCQCEWLGQCKATFAVVVVVVNIYRFTVRFSFPRFSLNIVNILSISTSFFLHVKRCRKEFSLCLFSLHSQISLRGIRKRFIVPG